MSNVISVENLGKKYLISHQGREPYTALRDVLADGARAFCRRMFTPGTSQADAQAEEFWALKDVSFEVKQGDRIGIIGRNGAGKSTLLKILSRITEPTEGRVRIRGRVASLLEVGTGFHPELTGRENIFLNGAILGMHRVEIARKFDEIVAFAEIEKFLDTPVKRYSSGMYVRLAFAVAAHLEPEILIVDEVLAVGDAQFQKKCLGKMEDISAKEGRTVLFVSHNMGAIARLCTGAVLLERGRMRLADFTKPVIQMYLDKAKKTTSTWSRSTSIPVHDEIVFESISIANKDRKIAEVLPSNEPFSITLVVNATASLKGVQIAIRITNEQGIPILTTTNCDQAGKLQEISRGRYRYTVSLPASFLPPGYYTLIVASFVPGEKLFDVVEDKLGFCIDDMGSLATLMKDGRLGVVTPLMPWDEVRL